MASQGRIIHEAGEAKASGPVTDRSPRTARYHENLQSRTTSGPEMSNLYIFDFADELIQFAKFARKHVRDKKTGISIKLQMYIAASAPGICDFPNVNVALGSYLCILQR